MTTAMNLFRKNKILILLAIIVLAGAYLRFWHFTDWLHFELDQSRDAKIIDLAIKEGPSNLPLLGPKAAGTFLRLGPAFYYFKYFSGLIFGNTPSGIAVVIMIFGILAIPMLYLFVRRYFSEILSVGLTFIFSVSLYLVVYSRFSWNPNSLPLWTLLTFFSLLKVVELEEKRRGFWLLLAAFSLAIATQMHFLAFVAVPAISVLFLIIKRPKIGWRYWAGAVLIIVFLYTPAIINDVATGGKNIGQFFGVAQGKSENSDHDIIEKAIKSYDENALGYTTTVFGLEKRELPRITFEKKNIFRSVCDGSCSNEIYGGIFSLLFFTLGIIFLIYRLIRETDQKRKDFLILTAIWFFLVLGLYIPISYNISPRFFLLVAVIPFVFLGLILEFLLNLIRNKKIASGAVIILILAVSGYNLCKIKQRFWQLDNASKLSFDVETDRILKEKTRVTLSQQYLIINYILEKQKENHWPVYLNSDPEYRRSLLFHLDENNIPRDDWRNATNAGKIYEHGNYFLVYPTLSNWKKDIDKYANNFTLVEQKEFGTLTLFQLTPKPEAVTALQQDFSQEKSSGSSGTPKRYKWEEIFNDSSGDENTVDN